MLAADEFTVGRLTDAKPLSLMLPHRQLEDALLIGHGEQGPLAVILSGKYSFHFIKCSDAPNWTGLLIPNVRIEVDERSLFDPRYVSAGHGTLVRTDTRLAISAITEHSFGRSSWVSLESDLPPVHDLSAGFSRWRIVIGEGRDKRVLQEVDTGQKLEA